MSDETPRYSDAARRLAVIVLLLWLAGCAGNLGNGGANADNDRNSGFYGGVTGGGNRL